LSRIDHFGFTVPDLEEARDFLVEVLGCEFLYSGGPMQSSGTWMTDHLGVASDTVMRQFYLFRLGKTDLLEVFQYDAKDQETEPPRNSDVGGHHIAFYVNDMNAAVEKLRAHGIKMLGDPTPSASHGAGRSWLYFLAPWGMQLELVSYPE
jgi:glyoxylase I family protein